MKRNVFFMSILFLILPFVVFAGGKGEGVQDAGENILYVGMQDDIKTLNSFANNDVWTMNVLWKVTDHDYLYRETPVDFEWKPWMADGMPEIDLNNLTAVVKLKKGIKFSDGKPLTADDVVYTHGEIMLRLKMPQSWDSFQFIDKIEKVDDYTVKYYLKEMRATFKYSTLEETILPKHIWEPIITECIGNNDISTEEGMLAVQQAVLDYDVPQEKFIGCGPFMLKEWKQGEYIALERNPNYFATGMEVKAGDKKLKVGPYVDGIVFKIYKSLDTAILAIQKSKPEIDFIYWPVTPGYVPDIVTNPDIYLTTNPQNAMYYLAFNLRKAPFSDLKFRKAMAYLIDKNFIQTRVLQNYGERLDTPVPKGNVFWHNPNVESYGNAVNMNKEDRIAKALEILKGAGYRWKDEGNHTGLIMPNGESVKPFEILTPPADYDPYRAMCGVLIQEWWKSVGVPVRAKPTSFGEIVQKAFTDRTFDVYILGFVDLPVYPSYIRSYYHSSFDILDGDNAAGFRNDEFDALADRFVQEMDMDKSREMAFKVQEVLADQLPHIHLFCKSAIEVHTKRFEGWINQLNGTATDQWSFLFLKQK